MQRLFTIALLFLLLLAPKAKAQSPTFLDSTAVWNMEMSFFRDFNSPPPIYFSYELGDTQQIGSYNYRSINYVGPGNNGTFGYIREIGARVYMRLDTAVVGLLDSTAYSTEFLVYDFSLQLGDTIPLRVYNRASLPPQKDFYYRVTKVDSVQTMVGKRKRLVMRHIYQQDSGWVGSNPNPFVALCIDSLNWIEGIGSDFSPTYNLDAISCVFNRLGWEADFIKTTCHSKNGQLLYQPFGACENISLPETKAALPFSVYPNPAKDFIELKADARITRIRWLNLQGQVVQEINEPSTRLSIGHLKNGLYFLLVQFEGGSSGTVKVIVEK